MSLTDSILDEEVLPSLLDTIHDGTGLTDIASVLLYNGFTQGKWSPDTMMLLMEPTLYLLMFLADQANIEYIIEYDSNMKLINETFVELGANILNSICE